MAVMVAVVAAYGVFLVTTARLFGWRGVGLGPRLGPRARPRTRDWMVQAGLGDVRPVEFVSTTAALAVVGAGLGFVLFGGVLAPLGGGLGLATVPIGLHRSRRERRRMDGREAWPRMIEEVRVLTGSLGRSVPQALLDVGERGPAELRPAFVAAHREWLLSTDFERTVRVLKDGLADSTADAACETLLVAHEIGGSDLDARLAALVDDRVRDVQGRKDAAARQSGVRFARRFVLLVPVGMALAGLSIGNGRQAYSDASGQLGVAVALTMIGACWVWAGRLLRLPDEERVFA